jgi:ParB-like chromosome segregation protein Spo0J
MDAVTPPDFDAMRRAIEKTGRDAMKADAGNRQVLFEHAICEVLDLRAQAMEIYLRQARNPEVQRKAHQTRKRAERRVGQLLIAAVRTGVRYVRPKNTKIGEPTDLITLEKLGISRKQSQDWQKLARMADADFEIFLSDPTTKSITARLGRRGTRRHAHVDEAGQLSSTAAMSIANIKIGTRHRKDLGDIEGLARSIADVGLLHPIVVRADGTLIAGERRLEACKQLGWTDVPVTVVDLDDIVRGELAENAERKDFLPSEIDAIRRALEPIEKAAAKARMSEGGGDQRSADRVGKISTPDAGKTRDKIGAFAGVSGRTVEKIAAVVDAAETEPEKFGHLVEEMDKTGKVDRAHKQLHKKGEGQRRTPRQSKPASGTELTPPVVTDAPGDVARPGVPLLPSQASISPAPPPDPVDAAIDRATPDDVHVLDADLPTNFEARRGQKISLDEKLGNLIFLTESTISDLVSEMRAAGRLPELFRRFRRVIDKLEAEAAAELEMFDESQSPIDTAGIEPPSSEPPTPPPAA